MHAPTSKDAKLISIDELAEKHQHGHGGDFPTSSVSLDNRYQIPTEPFAQDARKHLRTLEELLHTSRMSARTLVDPARACLHRYHPQER